MSLEAAKAMALGFSEHLDTHFYLLVSFYASCFFFLQTWVFPGTLTFAVIGGSLFGVSRAFIYSILMTSLGSYATFTWSKHFGKTLVKTKFIKTKAEKMIRLVEKNEDNLFWYLTCVRMFPASPNWLINLAFPHLGVSNGYLFWSIFFGVMPRTLFLV